MDKRGIKPTTNHMLLTQKEYNTYLCHICGKTLGSMDTLKRHLDCHADETYKCPRFKYASPGMDAVRRHTDKELPRPTVTQETKPYQVNPSSVNRYMYQQTMPKQRGFPMDTTWTWYLTTRNFKTISYKWANYHTPCSCKTTSRSKTSTRNNVESMKETTSISSEIDHILNQIWNLYLAEWARLHAETTRTDETEPPPNYTEEEDTEAWTVFGSFGTVAMDEI